MTTALGVGTRSQADGALVRAQRPPAQYAPEVAHSVLVVRVALEALAVHSHRFRLQVGAADLRQFSGHGRSLDMAKPSDLRPSRRRSLVWSLITRHSNKA